MTGTKPPLFAYFVKNRLPELTVTESLTFLHRDKVFWGVCVFFNNLPNVRQYWSAPRQFLFFEGDEMDSQGGQYFQEMH